MPMGNSKGLGELWARLRFLFMAIIIYRIGTHIPVPGFDPDLLADMFKQQQGTYLGLFNMFSGGALERMSILALGVMPYISASIIMQLLSATVPALEQLKKEGDSGRRKINQYTRYGTVALALVQGLAMAKGFESQAYTGAEYFLPVAVSSLVAGAVFLMWLGEQITERGIGNGISMLIFAGIVAGIPGAIGQALESARQGDLNPLMLIVVLIIALAVVYFVVFIERGQRRLTCQLRSASGQKSLQRADFASSTQGQYGRCDTSDFCQ
jgi:preprotein translocase subunit SecY